MLTGHLWSHPQSEHGAILFPNFTRRIDGKLYVRNEDQFFQTGERQNGAYPINYEVTPDRAEYKAVAKAFAARAFEIDSTPSAEPRRFYDRSHGRKAA